MFVRLLLLRGRVFDVLWQGECGAAAVEPGAALALGPAGRVPYGPALSLSTRPRISRLLPAR